jgi:hypothetical protein
MISSYMQGGDVCENAPGLRVGTNNVEIAAMIAPKPMLMVSATGDWTKNTPVNEYPAIRRIYELYGKPENVETLQLEAPHNFNKQNREAVYRFFAKHILRAPDADQYAEKNADIQGLQNMLALAGRALPAGAASYPQVFGKWKQRQPASDSREALQLALRTHWPEEVVNDAEALSRPEIGDRVPYRFREGKGFPALIVGGTLDDAPAGRPALAIEVFKTRDHSGKYFSSFNEADDQLRVQDILTALAWLHTKYSGPIEIVGIGTAAGVQSEFAAAVAPIPVTLRIDLTAFHGTDEDFLKYFDVPGIQTAGGITAAGKLVGPKP